MANLPNLDRRFDRRNTNKIQISFDPNEIIPEIHSDSNNNNNNSMNSSSMPVVSIPPPIIINPPNISNNLSNNSNNPLNNNNNNNSMDLAIVPANSISSQAKYDQIRQFTLNNGNNLLQCLYNSNFTPQSISSILPSNSMNQSYLQFQTPNNNIPMPNKLIRMNPPYL